jgi:hypothetical protein
MQVANLVQQRRKELRLTQADAAAIRRQIPEIDRVL